MAAISSAKAALRRDLASPMMSLLEKVASSQSESLIVRVHLLFEGSAVLVVRWIVAASGLVPAVAIWPLP